MSLTRYRTSEHTVEQHDEGEYVLAVEAEHVIAEQRAEIERLANENIMLRSGWPDFTKLQADLAACRAQLSKEAP